MLSAAIAVAAICRAFRPATSYIAFGVSWSMNTSGKVIVRILRPRSRVPEDARKCRTCAPKPPAAPSSTVTTT